MSIRAVIFDVYKTVLEVGPPPPAADARWEMLWQEKMNSPLRLSFAAFSSACERIIGKQHSDARIVGINFPEIFWPDVAVKALPELARLTAGERDDFLFCHAQLIRTTRLAPGAAPALRFLRDAGMPLGIASNAQPYTIRELDTALSEAGLSGKIFSPDLCFWSFEHGFSKPDPHVFRLLAARLAARNIPPDQALMVGDRCDNDIEPARTQGWQTWHMQPQSPARPGGDWLSLHQLLESKKGSVRPL